MVERKRDYSEHFRRRDALGQGLSAIHENKDRLTPEEQELLQRTLLEAYIGGEIAGMIDRHLSPDAVLRTLSAQSREVPEE